MPGDIVWYSAQLQCSRSSGDTRLLCMLYLKSEAK